MMMRMIINNILTRQIIIVSVVCVFVHIFYFIGKDLSVPEYKAKPINLMFRAYYMVGRKLAICSAFIEHMILKQYGITSLSSSSSS